MIDDTKICKGCQEEKSVDEFIAYGKRTCFCVRCKRIKGNEASKRSRDKLKSKDLEAYRAKEKENYEKNKEKLKLNYKRKMDDPAFIKKSRQRARENYWNGGKQVSKEWKLKNKDKINEKRNRDRKIQRKLYPERFLTEKIATSFQRCVKKAQKSQTALLYTGCESIEQFITTLSQKTENSNWIKEGYHIDHIWQLNWFDERFFIEDFHTVALVFSNHSNLRPLQKNENLSRSLLDFSPLNKNDFEKYKPFLKEKIVRALLFFWENENLFKKLPIKRGSQEESILFTIS